jgi:predicted RNase H-like nuclease (RuvC/YqgF family)
MKDKLKKKKWKDLTEEERCYYLSNKTSYSQSVVKAKLTHKNKLDKTIEKKRQNIERLKQEIEEKKKHIEEYKEQKHQERIDNHGILKSLSDRSAATYRTY